MKVALDELLKTKGKKSALDKFMKTKKEQREPALQGSHQPAKRC